MGITFPAHAARQEKLLRHHHRPAQNVSIGEHCLCDASIAEWFVVCSVLCGNSHFGSHRVRLLKQGLDIYSLRGLRR